MGTRTPGSVGGSGKRSGSKDRHRASGLPNHVVQLGGKAADQVRRDEYNRHGRSSTGEGKWIKGTRYSLLKDTAKQTAKQLLKLAEVVLTNKPLYRAFLLYGELRNIYRLPYHEAVERLEAWLAWASRSRLKPFVKLARTIRKHKAGVLAAIELNLSNGRLEAPNSKVRLLSHRAYGFHSADALIAMISSAARASRSRSPTDESPPNGEESRIFAVLIVGPFHSHPVAQIGTSLGPFKPTEALGVVSC